MLTRPVIHEVPVFGLADYALFPYTVAALQVFEPAHRDMIDDSRASDRLLVVAGLSPEGDEGGAQLPPVYETAGLGKLVNVRNLEDGSREVYLHGIARVRVVRVLREAPYRVARVERLDDLEPRGDRWHQRRALRRLHDYLNGLLRGGGLGSDLSRVISASDDPTVLSYRLGALLVHDPAERQRFLEMRSLLARLEVLTERLGDLLLEREEAALAADDGPEAAAPLLLN